MAGEKYSNPVKTNLSFSPSPSGEKPCGKNTLSGHSIVMVALPVSQENGSQITY